MENKRKVLCNRCRKFVDVLDVKYLQTSTGTTITVCSTCRSKPPVGGKNISSSKQEPEKQKYFCSRCKYKFKSNPLKGDSTKCPYCGKADKVIEDKPVSASSFLID